MKRKKILILALLALCLIKLPVNANSKKIGILDKMHESALLVDESYSMNETFKEEKNMIIKKIFNVQFYDLTEYFGSSKETNLWKTVNTNLEEYEKIVVISDLWDRAFDELEETNNKTICLLVPYFSTDSEGTEHVMNTVKETFLKKCHSVIVYTVYLDGQLQTFTNDIERDMVLPEVPCDSEEDPPIPLLIIEK